MSSIVVILNDFLTGALKYGHTSSIQRTAADAFFQGYKILVQEDYVEAFNKEAQIGMDVKLRT